MRRTDIEIEARELIKMHERLVKIIVPALIEPDLPISGIRLADWLHPEAHEKDH